MLILTSCLLPARCLGEEGAPAATVAPITEAEISALQQELLQGASASIPSESRRAYKSVIRQGQALLSATPDASNRFAVLGVIFEGQKRLLPLENDEQNRDAVFATANELLKAPDEFAELRLGADLLLMEKSLGEQNARIAERIEVLKKLLPSYRGTPAEWKSLMIGSVIATKLLDYDVVNSIDARILERFAGDHEAIQYRRAKDPMIPLDVVFSGTYKAADGTSVSLPLDRWGHQVIAYFWSQTTPRIDDYLREAKELQKAHPGRFDVISFNVDELPDAGQKKLKSLGLDWEVLHLPGGRENSTYQAYARIDPCAVFVNAQGHALLKASPQRLGITAVKDVPEGVRGQNLSDLTWALDDARYLAQLRYLFVGDFLIADLPESASIPPEVLQPIQACFVPVPFRYRLRRDEELANYSKAAALCTSALGKDADSKDAWMLRNRKIIALIGMWNLSGKVTHLDAAVTEAKTLLDMELPSGADVVARFCLAKAALRGGDADPEVLVADFIAACGGEAVHPSALAAATVLALDANARSLHERYRTRFLALDGNIGAGLWPVRAFLTDRMHRQRNFWASPGGFQYDDKLSKYGYRQAISGLLDPPPRTPPVTIELKKLDGGRLMIPKDMPKRAVAVIFAEPLNNVAEQGSAIRLAKNFAGDFKRYGVDTVVAWITDDTNTIKALVQGDNGVQVAIVPGGLKNPLVQKLGILSADRIPNMFLFRPDGMLSWTLSGLDYQWCDRQGPELAIKYGIVNNIDKLNTDPGFEALERGEYKEALKRWGAFKAHAPKEDWWLSDRRHGEALACMGLKDWPAALKAVDEAIQSRGWLFKSGICACHGYVEMRLTKASILDRLGRSDEAEAARDEASQESLPHADMVEGDAFRVGVPIGVYYDWLKKIRLGMEGVNGPSNQ